MLTERKSVVRWYFGFPTCSVGIEKIPSHKCYSLGIKASIRPRKSICPNSRALSTMSIFVHISSVRERDFIIQGKATGRKY